MEKKIKINLFKMLYHYVKMEDFMSKKHIFCWRMEKWNRLLKFWFRDAIVKIFKDA